MAEDMESLLAAATVAVVGASRRADKYGHLVYQTLKAAGKTVFPVNPKADTIAGDPCFPSLAALPQVPEVAVLVVPPAVAEAAVAECARLGIGGVWMQPGAESEAAVRACHAGDITVVSGGPCIMVLLRTHGYVHR